MDRDQELALLGMLEGQLGERQRALGGLHLGEGASRSLHAEMVELQHKASELEQAEQAAAVAIPPDLRGTAVPGGAGSTRAVEQAPRELTAVSGGSPPRSPGPGC